MKFTILTLISSLAILSAEESKPINLLDKDLSHWTFITKEGEAPAAPTWKLENGILSTSGDPTGYLRTKDTFKNYTLTLEWRWLPAADDTEKKGGNSGLLVHCGDIAEGKSWPPCIESQLEQNNAGDFWMIGEKIEANGENKGGRWIRTADPKEKTLGEWNTMIVTCNKDTISIHVNGTLVNQGKNSTTTSGAIAFQSEGSPIEFRNIILTP